MTRFEQRGLDAGRTIRDLTAVRTEVAWIPERGASMLERLEAEGARKQRPLWASTGVKNPDYPDTLYVVDLAAPNTVNTMPEKTLDAVIDHGEVQGDQVTGRHDEAAKVLDDLDGLGISYTEVTDLLEREGVEKFEKSWTELLDGVQAELEKVSR